MRHWIRLAHRPGLRAWISDRSIRLDPPGATWRYDFSDEEETRDFLQGFEAELARVCGCAPVVLADVPTTVFVEEPLFGAPTQALKIVASTEGVELEYLTALRPPLLRKIPKELCAEIHPGVRRLLGEWLLLGRCPGMSAL
jgi:hypothetical protein